MDQRHSTSDPLLSDELRRQMLRFATLQLQDAQLAEDAVQEALLGAFKYADSFNGRAAYKNWVFAILKHKIVDVIRKNQRLVTIASLGGDDSNDLEEQLFNQRGMWHREERPVEWSAPESSREDDEFWTLFELCLDKLPPNQGRTFMMREFVGLESPEICRELNLTVSNLNVLLYRARLRLRECLENTWQKQGDCAC
ncbi:sigma-70 family RNA polymerase sigma factor [Oceanisphaera arctica]|uniref:RNA polymerase subunit sigma n=1 Tax=Oceanisphaera arctica TaxID=641510 RepID=A0A2P5TIQ2_9GAMM|nr:sigma-70 family RNA polymerase sigma factor [Oceanisphaera arctica]PPL14619.1 RNA polymerase subunit sigma [Oceanisphaera arctica]GHA10069.1 RNA polymerase sigma factor [Oceanisphaera arctica]